MSSNLFPEGLGVPRRKTVDSALGTEDELEVVYRTHYTLLLYISCRKFKVPPGDAESLIQEVFLSYLSTRSDVRDVRSWLVGAISNASRGYWRSRGRTESLPEEINERSDPFSTGFAETVANRITIRETLSRLHERCRETLRLHYFEGCSAPEVARELSTTNRFAEKLIHKCLKRAHKIYLTLTAGRP